VDKFKYDFEKKIKVQSHIKQYTNKQIKMIGQIKQMCFIVRIEIEKILKRAD
jgi:hypothetical protein